MLWLLNGNFSYHIAYFQYVTSFCNIKLYTLRVRVDFNLGNMLTCKRNYFKRFAFCASHNNI